MNHTRSSATLEHQNIFRGPRWGKLQLALIANSAKSHRLKPAPPKPSSLTNADAADEERGGCVLRGTARSRSRLGWCTRTSRAHTRPRAHREFENVGEKKCGEAVRGGEGQAGRTQVLREGARPVPLEFQQPQMDRPGGLSYESA